MSDDDCVHPYDSVTKKVLHLHVMDGITSSSSNRYPGKQIGHGMPVMFCTRCETVVDDEDIRIDGVRGLSVGRETGGDT